jgi:hypothetical protein
MTTVNTATNNSASAGQLADRVAQLMECMRRLVDKGKAIGGCGSGGLVGAGGPGGHRQL